MGQELTPAQLERLKQQRTERFKAMGLPATAGQLIDVPVESIPQQRVYAAPAPVVEESAQPQYDVPQQTDVQIPNQANVETAIQQQLAEERAQRQMDMYKAPRDKFTALQAIRSGAKKQEFNTFIKAEANGGKGAQLPEPKVGKKRPTRPGQPQEKSASAVAPEGFIPKGGSGELDMLEGLFTDKSPGISMRSSGNAGPQGTLIETDENYSNVGPSFDPVSHLKAKAAEKGIVLDLNKKKQVLTEGETHQIYQTGNSEQLDRMMLMMEAMMKSQQQNKTIDIDALKDEMRAIAKKAAEDTIRKVLKEYAESQKKKNIFEVVNKDQNVVKIGDKYYKLQPVVPKH
jgi:hypothetical protein